MKIQKLLLDVDTGIDDSIAILYALKKPGVRVVGISTGCGNTNAAQAAENSLRLIRLAGAEYDVPVAIGENKPLVGEWAGPVPHIHGDNGIGNVELPKSGQLPVSEHAVDFIIRLAKEHSGELVLVTLGRLTNLALALKKAPGIVRDIKRVVAMGGTVYETGNASPVAEANIVGDPEAADFVLNSGLDITLVGLDVTKKTRLEMRRIDWLRENCAPECAPIAEYLHEALTFYMDFNRRQNNCVGDCPVHDPLALMAAVCPELVITRRMKTRVELGGEYCRGMLVTDLREQPFEAEYIDICLEVDGERAVCELLSVFTRP